MAPDPNHRSGIQVRKNNGQVMDSNTGTIYFTSNARSNEERQPRSQPQQQQQQGLPDDWAQYQEWKQYQAWRQQQQQQQQPQAGHPSQFSGQQGYLPTAGQPRQIQAPSSREPGGQSGKLSIGNDEYSVSFAKAKKGWSNDRVEELNEGEGRN